MKRRNLRGFWMMLDTLSVGASPMKCGVSAAHYCSEAGARSVPGFCRTATAFFSGLVGKIRMRRGLERGAAPLKLSPPKASGLWKPFLESSSTEADFWLNHCFIKIYCSSRALGWQGAASESRVQGIVSPARGVRGGSAPSIRTGHAVSSRPGHRTAEASPDVHTSAEIAAARLQITESPDRAGTPKTDSGVRGELSTPAGKSRRGGAPFGPPPISEGSPAFRKLVPPPGSP
jgi:hypothetical protein